MLYYLPLLLIPITNLTSTKFDLIKWTGDKFKLNIL